MDHAFEFESRPHRRACTVTVRTFCWDPWPEDLLAALATLDIDAMAGGVRGTLSTSKVTVRTEFAVGEFEVVLR